MSPRALLLCLLATGLVVGGGALRAPGEEELDLAARLPDDETLETMATLPNGMRYWIRPCDKPKGAVRLALYIAAGSLHEDEDQLGYAHFVEHMAFNGTEHFPPGKVIEYFESIGLKFGQHSNAETGFSGTDYRILLRDTSAAGLRRALLFLSDVSRGITFPPKEVEQEKAVILEEIRVRRDRAMRVTEKTIRALGPKTRAAQRLPLGTAAMVRAATPKKLRAYYETWYRPDRATLIVVGDVATEAISPLITEAFGPWKKPSQPVPDIAPGRPGMTGVRAGLIMDRDQRKAEVSFSSLREPRHVESVGGLRTEVIELVAGQMLRERVTAAMRFPGTNIRTAELTLMDGWPGYELAMLEAETHPMRWEAALEELLLELRRVELHGFTQAECDRTCAGAQARNKTDTAPTSWAVGARLLAYAEDGSRPVSELAEEAWTARILETITAAECRAGLFETLDPRRGVILVTLPPLPEDWAAAIAGKALEIHRAVMAAEVPHRPAVADSPGRKPLLDQDPEPRAVRSRTHDEALDITSWTLENGVRVHVKPLATPGRIELFVHLLGGRIEETAANRGITSLVARALESGLVCTPDCTQDELEDYLDVRGMGYEVEADDDTVRLTIRTDPEHIEDALRLLWVVLRGARMAPALIRGAKSAAYQDGMDLLDDPAWAASTLATMSMSGEDVRFAPVTPEQADAIRLPQAQAWLDRLIHAAPLEAGFTGDMDAKDAEPLIRRWFASLPKRADRVGAVHALRKVKGATGPFTHTETVRTRGGTGSAVLMWRGVPHDAARRQSALRHAGTILKSRLRKALREEHGYTYALQSDYGSSDYEDMGALFVRLDVDPARAEETARAAKEIVVAFAKDGPTEEEIENCRKQWRNMLGMARDDPTLWRSVFTSVCHDELPLANIALVLETLENLDAKLLIETVREVVREDRYFQVITLPQK